MSCNCNNHLEHNHNHPEHRDEVCDIKCSCHSHDSDSDSRKSLITRLIAGGIIFAIAVFCDIKLLFVAAYLILGYDVLLGAVQNLRHIFNENFLMSIATIGAFATGEFAEAVAVMLFYQIGEYISDFAVGKSKKSITELMDLRADTATVLHGNQQVTLPCEDVKIGEHILVLPGDKIPLDGKVVKGSATLDLSSLTGESMPVCITEGSEVISGSVNTNSPLEIEVTKDFSESTVSKILKLVQSEKKSKSEKFITKFASVYTPIVVLAALLLILIPLPFTGDLKSRIYTAMMFLVVSCPCALVVSVPLTFVAGIGGASRSGILIKGSYALEQLAKTEIAAFDKTGTLTEGDFRVREIQTDGDAELFLKYAAYAEAYSQHPISKAILSEYDADIDFSLITDYAETAGNGVSATIDGHRIKIGSRRFIGYGKDIKNAVYLAVDDVPRGYIVIEDKIRLSAVPALKKITDLGIETIMLTGDSDANAKSCSEALNIEYRASLLPQDKVKHIKDYEKNTLFVGDGINDAPVLSCADIGVSMGGIGSDAAIEAGDIVIMADNLEKIPLAVKISRKTAKIVRENIIFAIGVKLLIMLLGVLNLASMWLAVFADVGVCLLAVLNAVRALCIKD